MLSADNDPGATRVMPPVQPQGIGSPPPKRGMKTWQIVALAALGGIVVGGIVVWLLVNSRSGLLTGVTPLTSTVATTQATSQLATSSNPVVAPSTPPQSPLAATTPKPDTTPPKTPKFKFPPNNYWLSPDDMKVEIKWSSVSDPSGVSYVLEFSEWLGGGAGWTETKRISPIKRLYYDRTAESFKERYRIIAIDGAGNESDPSAYSFLIQAGSASEAASLNASYHP